MRFVQLPIALLNDDRVSDTAVRVYSIMLDASRDNISRISVERIGERLGRGRTKYAAMAAVKQLVSAGHVVRRKRGRGAESLLVSGCAETTSVGQSSCPETTDRLRGDSQSGCPDATLSIRSSLNLLSTERLAAQNTQIRTEDEARQRLLDLLATAQLDEETAKKEADRLMRRFFPFLQTSAEGHLRFAIASNIADPVEYTIRATQRGEIPRTIEEVASHA